MLNERLKSLRLAKGLTLQQVGDVFGISRASVANWESGKNQPDPRKLKELASLFDATVEYLVTGQSRSPSELMDSQRGQVRFVPWEKILDKTFNSQDQWIPALYTTPSSEAFATRLVGSSSIDWISGPVPLGAIIVIEPFTSTSQGSFVLAVDGSNEMGLAEISTTSEEGFYRLNFKNKKSIVLTNGNEKIIGTVVEWRLGGKL